MTMRENAREAYSTKRVLAWPENRLGVDGYAIRYRDGYQSWCPADVYERDYDENDGGHLTFGEAIAALQHGDRVARIGWNGKSMWLSLSCGETREVAAENFWSPHNRAFAEANGGTAPVLPCITLKTAGDAIAMGWTPSQADMFADDWFVLQESAS